MATSVKTKPTSLYYKKVKGRDKLFLSTRWTVILEAGDSAATSEQAIGALSELCQIYWRPLYAFVRNKGYGHEDAQDLTQGFFARLIETRGHAHADPEKGRFRRFLLTAFKNFIADARDRERALKRGGGMIPEELDDKTEAQIAPDAKAKFHANEVYDCEWAAALVRHALKRLAQEWALAGKSEQFGHFVSHLAAEEESAIPYDELPRDSYRAAACFRSQLARLRARFRSILRDEVRGTLREGGNVDEELRHLCRALAAAHRKQHQR